MNKDLAHIAKVMYDLQEYCRYIDEINDNGYCDGCTFVFDHHKCKLIKLTKDNKIPCDNWNITKADIERLGARQMTKQKFWEMLVEVFERYDVPCKFCPVEGEDDPMCAISCEKALNNVYERLRGENQ